MTTEDQLREMISGMLRVPANSIDGGTSLAGLDDSLGEARLRLGLKRLGLRLSPGVRPANFEDLCNILSGKAASSVRPKPHTIPPVSRDSGHEGFAVGLDVQDVGALPVAINYCENTFYSATFAKSEIAYAEAQQDPRAHFAGFWCAKEALRKCDPSFTAVESIETIVAHEAGGRPFFIWDGPLGERRLRHALSISHSGPIAMAIVIDRAHE